MLASLTLAVALVFQPQPPPKNDLLNKIPAWANALIAVNLKDVLASPFAQKEQWDKFLPIDILGGSVPLPKNADVSILASNLEPGTLKSRRDIALIQGGPFPPFNELAKIEKGIEETLAGLPAILSPKNCYILSFGPKQLAIVSPAHRQETARWARFAQASDAPVLSSYLQQAHAAMNDGYHIVVAIDMQNAVDPQSVRRYLSQSPLLKDRKVDIEALAKVLTSSRGIRIGVRFDQGIKATLAADFGESIKPFASVLPALVLAGYADMGGDLEEFAVNNAVVQDKTFLITSTLTTKGLRNVMQLIPPFTGAAMAPREVPVAKNGGPAEISVAASQKFFKSIREIANEAHATADQKNDMILAALAYEKAANRIDFLSVQGVDEDLVKFAGFASSKLREIADALRKSIIEANAVEGGRKVRVQVIPGFFMGQYNIGPWNPWNPGDPTAPPGLWVRPYITPPQVNVTSNDAEIQGKQAEVLARGARRRLELWRQLSDESANLRRQLSIRYRVEF
ncbi:MAG: hypothetical protein QM703_16380 [Gemmatales bacterium]